METLAGIEELRRRLAEVRREFRKVAFVPTMGAFHAGHLELIRRAQAETDPASRLPPFVVVSIFVNPTQFGPGEDFQAYPRDLERDSQKARAAGVDLLFAPAAEAIYPPGDATFVEVGRLGEGLCGPFRPGHFRGVATVVCKLFHIVQPDRAYFGEKDYQQLKIIQRMARDLHLPVKIVPVPTLRESDGLAMSSRNAYLSADERRTAPALYRALQAAKALAAKGEKDSAKLTGEANRVISAEPLVKLQYLELREAETLEPLQKLEKPAVLALAAYIGQTRLIDNLILPVP